MLASALQPKSPPEGGTDELKLGSVPSEEYPTGCAFRKYSRNLPEVHFVSFVFCKLACKAKRKPGSHHSAPRAQKHDACNACLISVSIRMKTEGAKETRSARRHRGIELWWND